jgi:23S rRNA G2445 N2-methylase RlmL
VHSVSFHLQSTVLERLNTLPFDGLLDWTAALSLWQFHRDDLDHVDTPGPQSDPAGENGSTESSDDKDDSTSNGGSSDKEREMAPSDNQAVGGVEDIVGRSASAGQGKRLYGSLLPSEGITFRVTCTRGGRKHGFSSPEAARSFGAGLADFFDWKVQLKNPDIEVLLAISGDEAKVGVALNREAKFKRNIAHFGPTTLRATIGYGMLRCAEIQPGDVVLDPLCGGGGISIEGSLAWPETHHIAGDIHHLAVQRAAANIESLLRQRNHGKEINHVKVDVCQWDVCQLPLRTSTVDVVVTDLPFGKKSGSRLANWSLYPKALGELARVCRPQTGRAVLLTHDNKAFSRALQRNVFWKRVKTLWLNVGGLEAALYILNRSSMLFH